MLPHLRCNGHSLLLSSYLSMIGRIENPSSSACGHLSQDTSHLILHCPATDSLRHSHFATLCLCTTSGPDPGEFPGFPGLLVFRHAPIPRKGSGNYNIVMPILILSSAYNQFMKQYYKIFNHSVSQINFRLKKYYSGWFDDEVKQLIHEKKNNSKVRSLKNT